MTTTDNIADLFAAWKRMHLEVKQGLIGAERLYATFIDDPSVPPMYVAAPYILCLERECIQFYKHKFPRFLRLRCPEIPVERFTSSNDDLLQMIKGSERISLGHFVNWMTQVKSGYHDGLMGHLDAFTKLFDPEEILFNKRMLTALSEQVLKYRKLCVHITRMAKWPTPETCKQIRSFVLLNAGALGRGFLPAFVELEEHVLSELGMTQ